MALTKIGASIVLEGEKEYRQALKEINSEQKELKSEMNLCSATYKEQQNSLEALQEKYEILTKQIEAQSKKVEVYNTALDEAKKVQEDAASNVDKYAEELQQAQEELEKMKSNSDASNESIDEQAKKVEELQGQLDSANTNYQKATENVSYWQTGLNNAQTELVNLNGNLEKNVQYMDEAKNSADHCATSIDEYGKKTQTAEENTTKFGDVAKGVFTSELMIKGLETIVDLVGKAGTGLFDLATNAAFLADDINTLSTKTGITTDTIQALQYGEELLDVSLETVTGAMAKNIKAMDNYTYGSEKICDAYDELGVSVTDANGDLRDSEEVFWETIDALGGMKNATEKDAIAMTIFGKSAQSLNPLIKAGSKGFQDIKKEAGDLGYILDNKTLDALNETSDGFERLSKYGDTIKREIGASMADDVNGALERIQTALENNEDKIKDVIEEIIPKIADGLVTVVENIDKIIPLVSGLATSFVVFKTGAIAVELAQGAMMLYKTATEGATIAQGLLNVAMDANPALLLVSAIAGLVAVYATYKDTVGDAKSKTDKFVEACDNELQTTKDHIEKRKENREELEKNITQTTKLKDELLELNKKEKLSTEEKGKMKQMVQELNSVFPELNLQLDEETGHLKGTNEEIEKQIENRQNLLKTQAAEDDLSSIASDIYEAEKTKNDILEQLEDATTKYDEFMAEAQKHAEDWKDGISSSFEFDGQIIDGYQQFDAIEKDLKDNVDAYNGALENQEGIINTLQGEYDKVSGYIDGYSGKVTENQAVVVGWRDQLITVNSDVAGSISELENEYIQAKYKAEESLNKQISLFGELSNKSDLTVEQMKNNLDSQTEVINTYADDMKKAKELVEKDMMDEGLLGELEELGLSGAGYLHELVTAADEDADAFNDVMKAWTDQQEAIDNLSGYLADMETNYTDSFDNIMLGAENLYENVTATQDDISTSWTVFGTDVGKILIENGKTWSDASTNAVKSMLSNTKNVLAIDESGKSAEGESIGKGYADSIATGIENGQDAINSAIDSVTNAANERIKKAVASLNRELGGLM